MVTLRPRSTSNLPSEAAVIPLPREETTPPVMKMYFVLMRGPPALGDKPRRLPDRLRYRCPVVLRGRAQPRPRVSHSSSAAAAPAVHWFQRGRELNPPNPSTRHACTRRR